MSGLRSTSVEADRTSHGWTLLFFLTLAVLLSRGVLELMVGKNAAYATQVGAIAGFTVLLVLFGKPHSRRGKGWVFVLGYTFLIAALLSTWVSLQLEHIDYAWAYVLATLFFVVVLLVYAVFDFEVVRRIAVGPTIAVLGLVIVGVAVGQQFGGLTLLEGSDRGTFGTLLRPGSTTGSFLHYPIAAALIVFLLLGIGAQRRKRAYYITAGVVGLGVALSLSRSGIVILIVGAIAAFVLAPRLSSRLRVFGVILFGAALALIAFPSGEFLSRVMSIFSTEGSGNTTRINVWTSVVTLWTDSPIVIGSHTGQFTNVTSNIAGVDTGVAESGVLQMLISFGLLGLVSYYGLMVATVTALPRVPAWFIAGAVGGIAQSAVYQSIEVLPFMILFALFPFIAAANNSLSSDALGEPTAAGPTRLAPLGRRGRL